MVPRSLIIPKALNHSTITPLNHTASQATDSLHTHSINTIINPCIMQRRTYQSSTPKRRNKSASLRCGDCRAPSRSELAAVAVEERTRKYACSSLFLICDGFSGIIIPAALARAFKVGQDTLRVSFVWDYVLVPTLDREKLVWAKQVCEPAG